MTQKGEADSEQQRNPERNSSYCLTEVNLQNQKKDDKTSKISNQIPWTNSTKLEIHLEESQKQILFIHTSCKDSTRNLKISKINF